MCGDFGDGSTLQPKLASVSNCEWLFMPDFIINRHKESSCEQMQALLKSRYPLPLPKAKGFLTSWGSIAILHNNFQGYNPIADQDGTLFLVIGRPLLIEES